MNPLIQHMVNQKIRAMTVDELVQQAKQFDISLTKAEARKILEIVRREKSINIKDTAQHKKIIRAIASEVSPQLAKKANELLLQYLPKVK